MPVTKVGNKWRIGTGKAMYTSKEKAMRAYRAYLAQKNSEGNKMITAIDVLGLCNESGPYQKTDQEILKATDGDDRLAKIIKLALQKMSSGGDEAESLDSAINKYTQVGEFKTMIARAENALSKLGINVKL